MRTVTFSPEVLGTIRHERYHHPHPRVQQKMEVLWLKSKGCTHEQIAELADVSRRTVQRYLDTYLAGGLESLRRLPWRVPVAALDAYQATLEDYFLENPPRSTREAQATIEQQTGVRRSLTQVRAFLKKVSACAGVKSGPSRPRPTPRSSRHSSGPSFAPA
jgi:transposase